MQEEDVYLPIVSQKYTIDLSHTRSHFLPGYPLDVVVSVKLPSPQMCTRVGQVCKKCCNWFLQVNLRLPDGSAAANVPVNIRVSTSETTWQGSTDQQGAVFTVFNIPSVIEITVEVSVEVDETEPFPSLKPSLTPTPWLQSGVSRWSSAEESL